MGTRERWVDEEEVEAKGSLAAAVLKSIHTRPGAIESGKFNARKGLPNCFPKRHVMFKGRMKRAVGEIQ